MTQNKERDLGRKLDQVELREIEFRRLQQLTGDMPELGKAITITREKEAAGLPVEVSSQDLSDDLHLKIIAKSVWSELGHSRPLRLTLDLIQNREERRQKESEARKPAIPPTPEAKKV